nr:hypothetical protein [Candidatus Sigynarchaeum springense]
MARLAVLPDIFERAGLVPHENIHWRWTVTAADQPRRHDKPPAAIKSPPKPCGVCGSQDTRCVYFHQETGKEPRTTYEYACDACGNYTTYLWEGW